MVIKPGDILILQGEPAALERIVALEKLQLTREGKSHEIDTPERRDRHHGGGDYAGLQAGRQLRGSAQVV